MTGAVKGTCAITGATGFLGNYLAEKMKESGWTVRRLQRRRERVKKTDDDIVYFSMGEKLNPDCLANVDLLIHCGYDFNCTNWQQINEINVTGTKLLFEAAKAANVGKIVFVSTMHAFEGCQTMYGRAKLFSEKDAFDHGAIVLRPGTIYGEKDGKLFGGQGGKTLQLFEKLFQMTPVMLIPYSKKPTVYTSHIEDIYHLIEEGVATNIASDKPMCAVNKEPLTLKEFLSIIRDRHGKKTVLFILVPWRVVWFLLLLLEKAKLKLPFRSETVLIFFDQNPSPDFSPLDRFKTKIRPFEKLQPKPAGGLVTG
jgi:nucleoside-diphosphate-sugar epimerase